MNAQSPMPNATSNPEEGAVSAPLEKLPKLNLPPKPVLATAVSATPPTAQPMVTPPAAKPAPASPLLAASPVVPPPPPQVTTPLKKSEPAEVPTVNKKRGSLSLPIALLAFAVALLTLIVQIFAFLHLF